MPTELAAFSPTLWIATGILAALMIRGAWRGYRRGPLRQLAGPAALTIGQLSGWLFGGELGHALLQGTSYPWMLRGITGVVGVLKYVIVHDCGTPMNPVVVDGQIQGGTVQGIGAALGEELIYDETGQLLTGSFMDYPMPRAADVLELEIEHVVYPTDLNPLGVRAAGEGGPISPPAAFAGAIEDALGRRVRVRKMPLTPQRVFELIQAAGTS